MGHQLNKPLYFEYEWQNNPDGNGNDPPPFPWELIPTNKVLQCNVTESSVSYSA